MFTKEQLIIIRMLSKAELQNSQPDKYSDELKAIVQTINDSPQLAKDSSHVVNMQKIYDAMVKDCYEVHGTFSAPGKYSVSSIEIVGKPVIGKDYVIDMGGHGVKMRLNEIISCDKIASHIC